MNQDELWRQCVEWLMLIGALPRNHKTCYPQAVVFDLAQTLRDGVVLCNTLNIIAPGVVDESQINHRAQMSEFLCMENIRVVIYTLQTYFRIPQSDLFIAQDLYQMTNFGKVLHALSCLSNIPEIAALYQPFHQNSRLLKHRQSSEEEDIYRNLPELASERSLADEDEELYDCVPEEKDEGIYGSVIDIKKTAPSPSLKLDKRGYCIHEIVETENNYVTHLDMMVEDFLKPLRSVLSENDLRSIFINIELLRPIHTKFRDELVKLQQSSQTAKFSEPFIRYREKFLNYGEYCSNLLDAQDCLEECMRKNELVQARVNECQMNSSGSKFKLRELLCVPMQRILKYHLLVKELNKHTPENHSDKSNLAHALKSMQELSQYVNEVKRDSEELVKINQIESRLEEYAGVELRKYGRVRYDGELKVKFADDRNPSVRNVFLFDKALFMTKLKNDSYILKDLIRMEDMQLDEMTSQKQRAKWSWCWKLSSLKHGVAAYVLYCKTEPEKAKWLEAFKNSFDNISPRALKGKKHNFEMQTFAEPTECSSCKLLLKGIFYQGYECSVTNARCHKHCLADTLKLIESNSLGASTEGRNKDKAPPVPDRGRKRLNPPKPAGQPSGPTVGSLSYKAHREYNGIPAPPFPNATIITFQIGQPIDVIEQVTADWWKGKSYADFDRIGFFPASFVSPLTQQRAHRPSYMEAQIRNPPSPSNRPRQQPGPNDELPVEDMCWYAGEIVRGKAEDLLWDTPSGTFLIRKKSPQNLVISLKYGTDVKHIKILQTVDNLYYVAECKNFRSVQELIGFYQNNSLSGFFLGLETTLKFPYRDPVMFPGRPSPTSPLRSNQSMASQRNPRRMPQNGRNEVAVNGRTYEIIGQARAKFDFVARSEQELSLRAGQPVNIISKAGGVHGWWKGEHSGQIGYFPTTFVEE